MKQIKLSSTLDMPIAATTQKFAWLGGTGSGKTHGASKLAEQFWLSGAKFVVLDPVGVWYGLRLQKDGKLSSHMDIPVFGGLHGDVPLEATGGALVADIAVDSGQSIIIDVSQFEHDTDKARFAKAFADRFFFRKKAAPSAVHLFLDECQEFVPQNPQRGEEGMLHAFVRMQKLGRNFGIGSSYITHRPQEVNKKALNLAQTLFVFRTTGPHERKAIEGWMEEKGIDRDIAGELPKLATGTCYVWSPEFLKVSKTVTIGEKGTFSASATPEVGQVGQARHLTPIDMDEIRAAMAATIEKAKQDDPKLLRAENQKLRASHAQEVHTFERRITDLEKMLRAAQAKPMTAVTVKPVLKDGQLKRIEGISAVAQRRIEALEKIAKDFQSGLSILATQLHLLNIAAPAKDGPPANPHSAARNTTLRVVASRHTDMTATAIARADSRGHGTRVTNHSVGDPENSAHRKDDEVGKSGLRRMLISLAQRPEGLTKRQIGVRAGLSSNTGTFRNYLSKARVNQWVTVQEPIRITEQGAAALGRFEALPTGPGLLDYWIRELGTSGASRMLSVLADAHPQALTKEELGQRASLSHLTGTFRNYLSKLRSLQLIEPGQNIKANDELFT